MSQARMQILQLLQAGKITVDEATGLLAAAERPGSEQLPPSPPRLTATLTADEEEETTQWAKQPKTRLPDLIGTYLDGAKLEGARLEGADLTGTYLGDADLRGADLRWADLTGTYLEGANLRNANLQGATLTGAYLAQADFENADLAGVNLTGTHMPGVKVRDGAFVFA